MNNVKLDYSNSGIKEKEMMTYAKQVAEIHKRLEAEAENEDAFLGWLKLPTNYDKTEFSRIKKAAKRIIKTSDVLLVIGIGGSYLGARAVIEALTHTFSNSLPKEKRKFPQIVYVGNNLNPNYINDVIDYIGDKEVSINVISKPIKKKAH